MTNKIRILKHFTLDEYQKLVGKKMSRDEINKYKEKNKISLRIFNKPFADITLRQAMLVNTEYNYKFKKNV